MAGEDETEPRSIPVPADRLSRLLRMGSLVGGIAGGLLLDGARQVAAGKRPALQDLLLTPANARKVADQLARMRGAAMKVGQLMSMDAGEVLPRELATILERLRAQADHMPAGQLHATLDAEWGRDWRSRFAQFDVRPIAAASIGQVHRARTTDGRDLAIKVQYPGIRSSIDSDVDNIATLARLPGLVPGSMDFAPLLREAKRQLHEEADYLREAEALTRFAGLLGSAPEFQVPGLHADLCTPNVLAMDYLDSVPIDALVHADHAVRDRVMTLLIGLVLRELFEFQLMQTDPNFANYRFNRATGQIVLLDFGATRSFAPSVAQDFRRLLDAGLSRDRSAAREAAMAVGLFAAGTAWTHQDGIMTMFDAAMEPLRMSGPFDFGSSDLAARLRDGGLAIGRQRDAVHLPPADTLLIQRKIAGTYLLASRLRARVDVARLVAPWS